MKDEIKKSKVGKRGILRSAEQRRMADQPLCTPKQGVAKRNRRKRLV